MEQVQFTTETGTFNIERMPEHAITSIHFKTDGDISLVIPLGRHIRTLVELFGYSEIQRLIDNFPESLRENNP